MAGEFAGLIEDKSVGRVALAVERIVGQSFERRTGAGLVLPETRTMSEYRRRTEIALRWFRVLRGDLKWSLERILDALPGALRTELDGGHWTPEDRPGWFAPSRAT